LAPFIDKFINESAADREILQLALLQFTDIMEVFLISVALFTL